MVKHPTPLLDKLFARIVRATLKHGEKTKLAREMEETPQRVNDWLSGINVPNGETTLRLLKWVEKHEAKQEKRRAVSGCTPTTLKTRKRKSTIK